MSTPIIAREGWSRISGFLILALVVQWFGGWWLATPFWVLVLLVVQFFRDPPRNIPRGDHLIVSPAHGKIVSIQPDKDPFSGDSCVRISVFMNIFSVHSNRIPIAGKVTDIKHTRGRFFNASLAKASSENERCGIQITTPQGIQVSSVQIAGWVARRILTYVKPGETVVAGQRYGFIRFGSRVDIYVPEDAKIVAKLGKWVLSGSDIIAQLTSREASVDSV